MRFIIIFSIAALMIACGAPQKKLSPLETVQVYSKAYKKKDITQMKLLLSTESIKMAESEAKAQGVTVDDIVIKEPLFSENQTTVRYRNVSEEGDTASVEVEDATGIWNTVRFVREEGFWKIDKKAFANQIEIDAQKSQEELDRIINEGKQP